MLLESSSQKPPTTHSKNKPCKFYGAANTIFYETQSDSKTAVIWLHGLGGNGERVYEKMKFSSLPASFYLPTASKLHTPWQEAGLLNSWFTLEKISNEKANAEAVRAADRLVRLFECVDGSGRYERIVIG